MKKLILACLSTTLILVCLSTRPARAACQVERAVTVPLQVTGTTITVSVAVNGTDTSFILDTGAGRSLVTEQAANRLGLARDPWVDTTMSGIGGIGRRRNANPKSLTLGGVRLVRRTINHDFSLTVGVMPYANVGNRMIDGLLGRDFLSLFDLDIDLPERQLTLYQIKDCTGRFLPWTFDYAALPGSIALPTQDAILLHVMLDGTPMRALLDTGAAGSIVSATGMNRLRLDPASLAADPSGQVAGVGARVLTVHRHRFSTLTVGTAVTASPLLWVEPLRLTPIVDMLLGADWLAGRRIWISFASGQVFLAKP